ncbi:MAG: MFS transporter [Acidobacteriota bacterium]
MRPNQEPPIYRAEPPGEGLLRNSPQRWWVMVLLVVAMICCYGQRNALSVATPFMMQELGLSRSVMGLLLSAFFWSYSFMQVPAGWLVDRSGVKRAYAMAFGAWSVITALTGFAKEFLNLILARILLGIGQAAAFPASARAVANWFRDQERGTVTATYLTGVRLGQAIVVAMGSWLLAAHGVRVFFLVIGLVPLVWLLPWMWFLGRWEGIEGADRPQASTSKGTPGASFLSSLRLLKHRSVLGIFLGFFAYDYAWFVYVTWLPGYLVLERRFSPLEMSVYSSVPFVAMSVIIMLSGLVSDWLIRKGCQEVRTRRAFIAAGLGVGCLIVPAGLVEDKMTAVWLLSTALCGLGISSPNTWTLTQAVCAKPIVGTVSGIQNFGGNLGGILAPALTGFIAQASHSFALALTLTGAIQVGGILAYWLLVSSPVQMELE